LENFYSGRVCLVVGVTGQDGRILSNLLASQGAVVIGTTRSKYFDLKGYTGQFTPVTSIDPMRVSDAEYLIGVHKPNFVFNFSGQSSVGLSYERAEETISSFVVPCENLLTAMLASSPATRYYDANSCEAFGESPVSIVENSSMAPVSPYGTAKKICSEIVRDFRERHQLYCTSGFLFNHESPLRSERFFSKRIVRAAKEISCGKRDFIEVGDLSLIRDMGWAPDYVRGILRIMLLDSPGDFVLCTESSDALSVFVKAVFDQFDLDFTQYVVENKEFYRPNEVKYMHGTAAKARKAIGWSPRVHNMSLLAKTLCRTYQGMEWIST
jgi:GDPmannose 4,6-dehydratase